MIAFFPAMGLEEANDMRGMMPLKVIMMMLINMTIKKLLHNLHVPTFFMPDDDDWIDCPSR